MLRGAAPVRRLSIYLGGADDWFSDAVALGDTHLLRQEHFLRRNFDAEVTACHHYAVGCLQYLVEPAQTH